MTADPERYSRQTRLPQIGPEGQARLGQRAALVVGVGALGNLSASLLVRAGVGRVVLVDRDVVERSNLQRQLLYDEDDVAARVPKAEAAARRLRRANPEVAIEARVVDLSAQNVADLVDGADVVLDGTDNLETRYLLNDACHRARKPWVYGGVVGTLGMTLALTPGAGPCFRCLFRDPPPPGTLPTCDTAGVLATAPALVACLQASEALKLLLGSAAVCRDLRCVDLWTNEFRSVAVQIDPDCPLCGQGRYEFLERRKTASVTTLCGRNSVQVSPAEPMQTSLEQLALRLAPLAQVRNTGYLLEVDLEGHSLIVFGDGRLLLQGSSDETLARSLFGRLLGG